MVIRKFRKKPIDAIQWKYDTIANINKIKEFIGCKPEYYGSTLTSGKYLIIKTLKGRLEVSLGDWIIKGIRGEFYSRKPDIFNETYEEIL